LADLTIDSNLGGTVGTKLSGSLGAVGPVSITGIPDSYSYRVKEIPKLTIGLDPIDLRLGPINTTLTIKEIPSVRTHLPANYMIALSLLGFEVAAVRLCGEGQIITEPYRPGACETCGHGRAGVQVRSA
jgi:hypothetical protein